MVANFLGASPYLSMILRLLWKTTTHNVSADVATCSNSGHESLVNCTHSGPKLCLDNTVELEGLAGGQLHRFVSKSCADIIHSNPLLWCSHTAWQSASNHKRVCGFEALCLPLISQVPVILHICAMELSQLLI